ncbi:MAG TPA: hypothetical protein VK066_13355 [Chloroflexota bacterium]|nr:hypothetical protein [Chloroflexota bacterium]
MRQPLPSSTSCLVIVGHDLALGKSYANLRLVEPSGRRATIEVKLEALVRAELLSLDLASAVSACPADDPNL